VRQQPAPPVRLFHPPARRTLQHRVPPRDTLEKTKQGKDLRRVSIACLIACHRVPPRAILPVTPVPRTLVPVFRASTRCPDSLESVPRRCATAPSAASARQPAGRGRRWPPCRPFAPDSRTTLPIWRTTPPR